MKKVCNHCGTFAEPAPNPKGKVNLWIVGLLSFIYFIPAVLYYFWCMHQQKTPVCASCGHESLVDAETPVGRDLMARFNHTADTAPEPRRIPREDLVDI